MSHAPIPASVGHVFAYPKNRYELLLRTTGLDRVQTKLTLENLAYNFDRVIIHARSAVTG